MILEEVYGTEQFNPLVFTQTAAWFSPLNWKNSTFVQPPQISTDTTLGNQESYCSCPLDERSYEMGKEDFYFRVIYVVPWSLSRPSVPGIQIITVITRSLQTGLNLWWPSQVLRTNPAQHSSPRTHSQRSKAQEQTSLIYCCLKTDAGPLFISIKRKNTQAPQMKSPAGFCLLECGMEIWQ